jgi:hypothetical protein
VHLEFVRQPLHSIYTQLEFPKVAHVLEISYCCLEITASGLWEVALNS